MLRSNVCAVFFWFGTFLAAIVFAIVLILVLLVAFVLEIVFQIRKDARVHPSSLSLGLDATEDQLLSKLCTSSVQHVLKEIVVSCDGSDYLCRGHALFVPHMNNANAPTVLLLHGNAASAFCFAELFDGLAENFNVLAIDLPGFGRTKSPRPPKHVATEFFGKFIAAYLAEMSLNRVYVVAHSFGAYVAIELANRTPQMVSHLMLLDSAGIFPTLGANGAYWAFFFKTSILQMHRNFGGPGRWAFFNLFHAFGSSLEVYYWYAVMGAADSWGDRAMADYIYLSWNRSYWCEPALPTLVALRIPIATAYGKDDDIMPPHQGDALSSVYGWPTQCFPNSGHVPLHGKDAEDMVKYIREFYSDVSSSESSETPTSAQCKHVDKKSLVNFQSRFSTTETMRTVRRLYKFLGSGAGSQVEVRRCDNDADEDLDDFVADRNGQIAF